MQDSKRRRLSTVLAITVACVGALFVAPTAAMAGEVTQQASSPVAGGAEVAGAQAYFKVNGARIRTQPNTTSTIVGLGYAGQGFCVDRVSGAFYHGRNQATGVVGWTHNSNVNYNPAVPC